ncbi:MAG: anhydro-N-acetylmuramic acid kinase [Alphaproteobacteria bacterium]
MNTKQKIYQVIGLMSGTSLDGVDAAILQTDGKTVSDFGAFLTMAYPETLRENIRNISQKNLQETEKEMTLFHAKVVDKLLKQAKLSNQEIDLIGFHGHTISHNPAEKHTHQIGDAQLLAEKTGINVVSDFRTKDVQAGGEGAPLVPIFLQAIAPEINAPLAFLNIGGVANITYINKETLSAFDTGTGNALIDDLVLKETGVPFDKGGEIAVRGMPHPKKLNALMDHPYFKMPPPKSLDRDDFYAAATLATRDIPFTDAVRLLSDFTAQSIVAGLQHLPERPKKIIITGGGRKNAYIMQALASKIPNIVLRTGEDFNLNSDALEAQAFGFLAVRTLHDLPISFPETTGVPKPITGGKIVEAP